jgi:hypothetical protein
LNHHLADHRAPTLIVGLHYVVQLDHIHAPALDRETLDHAAQR